MASLAIQHAPITAKEFAQMFHKCKPPVGWSKNIGVATSGGPDSSCLLFLIHRYLSEQKSSERPQRVFSLTVDHALQSASAAMAEHCLNFAQRLGVEHVTSKIKWAQPPISGEPFEAVARTVRYQALFDRMTEKNIDTLAFGHHIDDQVETSLLRLSWGSTDVGAAGMKLCRRWGMGRLKHGQSEYGFEGMNRWIVRPLLDVSKERILATCKANNLEYVIDPTNFQPGITLRNAIRHEIQASALNKHRTPPSMLPQDIVKRLTILETTARSLRNVSMSLDSSIEELRTGVRVLSQQARDLDDQVDSALKSCSLPTFPGTFLFSGTGLHRIEHPDVRRAVVLRLLRYISPYPWGSVNADAGRRKDSIGRITKQLWTRMTKKSRIRSFTAGGGVLWSPVTMKGNDIKLPKVVISEFFLEDDMFGWIASRIPPHRKKLAQEGLLNTLEIDATKTMVDAYQKWRNGGPSTTSILYDSRFLVKFDLDKMPQHLVSCLLDDPANQNRLMLLSRTRWFFPKVVIERDGVPETLHEKLFEEPSNSVFPVLRRRYQKQNSAEEIDSGWITTQWVRPLTAL